MRENGCLVRDAVSHWQPVQQLSVVCSLVEIVNSQQSTYLVLCVWFLLVVDTSASDCLERLVPEMICYVSRGTLNSLTHSLTLSVEVVYHSTFYSHLNFKVNFCLVMLQALAISQYFF